MLIFAWRIWRLRSVHHVPIVISIILPRLATLMQATVPASKDGRQVRSRFV
jgi:hypothetical protein